MSEFKKINMNWGVPLTLTLVLVVGVVAFLMGVNSSPNTPLESIVKVSPYVGVELFGIEQSVIPGDTTLVIQDGEINRYYLYKSDPRSVKIGSTVFNIDEKGNVETYEEHSTTGYEVGDVILKTVDDTVTFGGYRKSTPNKFVLNTNRYSFEYNVGVTFIDVETDKNVYQFRISSILVPENKIDLELNTITEKQPR